jgi:hypothetical protein
MRYSKGVSWIDDVRIPFVDGGEKPNAYSARKGGFQDVYVGGITNNIQDINTQGRFPANILVSDDMLNDGSIGKSNDHKWKGEDTSPIYGKYENRTRTQVYSDKGSNSRYYDIDKWFNNLIDV